uniref:Protein kinase domain-containing protein n=1 Tax=Oryzias latipes TaxID=8090 RepID=A0A3B3I7X4_ORYLA
MYHKGLIQGVERVHDTVIQSNFPPLKSTPVPLSKGLSNGEPALCGFQLDCHFLMGSLGLYQVGKFLGRGSYGRVAECTKMGSNETFAIKIVDDLRAGSEEMEAMKIIRSLNPDQNNLIKIHECFQYKDYMCLVYEMLDESLEDFIGKRSFHPAHLCQIRAIAQQMLVALSGLESINVLHGDIKPDNIMFVDQITNPLKLKLIDFGLAVNPQELNVGTQMQINPFRAPEVILGLPLDVSVDMWSLAVVLATLYIGDVPFSYNSDYETIRGLVQLLGLPEDDLLHYGKFSYDFFTYEEESSQPGWRLNTPFEYSEATGEVVKGLNEIPDLDAMAEFHHDTFPLYEEDDHRAFLDLLRSMLAIDPRQRMTPSSALAHDFITMNHLSGERKASYAASAKHAMREAGIKDMEERFPTTSTDVVNEWKTSVHQHTGAVWQCARARGGGDICMLPK